MLSPGGGGHASAGDQKLYVVGGQQLDSDFLATLVLPAGMRVLLYRNLDPQFSPEQLIDAHGTAANAAPLRPLIEQVIRQRRDTVETIGSGAEAETFHASPLPGYENNLLGVLLIGSSRRDLVELEALGSPHRHLRGGGRHPAGHAAELVGHRAHHPAGAAAGGKRRQSGRRQLGHHRRGSRHRRDRPTGAAPSIA